MTIIVVSSSSVSMNSARPCVSEEEKSRKGVRKRGAGKVRGKEKKGMWGKVMGEREEGTKCKWWWREVTKEKYTIETGWSMVSCCVASPRSDQMHVHSPRTVHRASRILQTHCPGCFWFCRCAISWSSASDHPPQWIVVWYVCKSETWGESNRVIE